MSDALLIPSEAFEAVECEHRLELAKARMQLVVYRECLEQHGIEPPDKNGEELLDLYRRCSAVISTASEFVGSLGSAKELLTESWAKAEIRRNN